MGYADNRKAYHLYDFQKRRVVFSRDVVFNEKVAGYRDEESDNESPHVTIDISEVDKTVETETTNEENVPPDNEQGEQENNETRQEPEIAPGSSTREHRVPDRYGEWINQANHIKEPQTVDEALTCSNREKWKEAMDEEYTSLMSNDVWEL